MTGYLLNLGKDLVVYSLTSTRKQNRSVTQVGFCFFLFYTILVRALFYQLFFLIIRNILFQNILCHCYMTLNKIHLVLSYFESKSHFHI